MRRGSIGPPWLRAARTAGHQRDAAHAGEAASGVIVDAGNFADGRKTFDVINYDDPAQFEAEREAIRETFTPLVGGSAGLLLPWGAMGWVGWGGVAVSVGGLVRAVNCLPSPALM